MDAQGPAGRPALSRALLILGLAMALVLPVLPAGAAPPQSAPGYWTAERIANAIPRDLVLDERGLGYLRMPDGSLRPHGHETPASAPRLRATPLPANNGKGGGGGGGGADTTVPEITAMDPGPEAKIGSAHGFRATVTDASGVKSVTFTVTPSGGSSQSFTAGHLGNDVWGVNLQGFTDGSWAWSVTAKDNAAKGGNTATSASVAFTVTIDTGGGSGGEDPAPPDDDVVTNHEWRGGAVQTAVGRILFRMPTNKAGTRWGDYVCSGTVVDPPAGTASTRSVVLTAAHCAYDDAAKVFARDVLFIPNQAESGKTDRSCTNDALGCWTASHGVVDVTWTTRTWPSNIPVDYAFYVFDTVGSSGRRLHDATGTLGVQFTEPTIGGRTHAIGYSYSEDPKLMYCAEGLGTESTHGDHWLNSCGLSGGSSGGPWIQQMDANTGKGPIISVNSWGYRDRAGMAGPRLWDTSAMCVFARTATVASNTAATCP